MQLLGGFLLHVNGAVVDASVSSQRLVAFVALHDGPVARPRVAGSLWLDKTEERAAANLRSALWRLNSCGAEIVVARGCHLSLHDRVRVDLHDLDCWARYSCPGDDHDHEIMSSDIILLAQHELLPAWYDDWVVIERERVRQRMLHALEAECLSLAAARQYARSIDIGLVAVAADPLRESAQRAVIAAHLAEGNRAEALRQFESYRRLLKMELGVEPSNALFDLLAGCALQPA